MTNDPQNETDPMLDPGFPPSEKAESTEETEPVKTIGEQTTAPTTIVSPC